MEVGNPFIRDIESRLSAARPLKPQMFGVGIRDEQPLLLFNVSGSSSEKPGVRETRRNGSGIQGQPPDQQR
jgi:hypothetical protein